MATTVGEIQLIARINTSQYQQDAKNIEKANDGIEKSADSTAKRSNAAFSTIAKVGLAAVASAAVAVGVAINKNIGNAIRRVDTLNNSSRTFANMGFDAEVASKSMKDLEKSITGLPTPLDSAVRGMTGLAATYGDIQKGQKVFSALNNAILGFGGSAEMVDNAIMQLSQLPMDGPLDAQTWNSLRNSGLTPVLVAMAKESGMSVSAMKKAFGDGQLTVEDFTNKLIDMNTKGGGGMKSLEKIAQDATGGISTSWANMQTAITRGIANVIRAIGSEDIAKFITNIGKAFERALNESSGFISFMKRNKDFILPIIVGISTLVGLITSLYVGIKLVAAAQAVWNAVMKANTLGSIIIAITAVVAALTYFFTQTETGRKVFETIKNVASDAWESIQGIWNGAVEVFKKIWQGIQDGIDDVKNAFDDAKDAVNDWYKDNEKAIKNVAIVIGTILLPKIVQIGVQFTIAAAKAVTAAAMTAGAWIASAISTSIAWLTQTLPRIIAGFVTMAGQAVINAARITAAFIASSVRTLVGWGITFAGYLAGLAIMVAQTMIAGARMAIGFALALGPIGLLVSAVIGAAALIITNWETVKRWITSFWDWLKTSAKNTWESIKGFFSRIGSTIGDALGNAFKGAINGILGFLEDRINSIIDTLNGAISAIDKVTPGSLPRIGKVSIPRLAEGGIITSPTLAMVGEGGEAEAVIPLSKLDKMLDNKREDRPYEPREVIRIPEQSSAEYRQGAVNTIKAYNEYLRSRGLPELGVA